MIPHPLDLLRTCHERRLNHEGIPMVLALVDERGEPAGEADPGLVAAGEVLAGLTAAYARELVPFARPEGDEAALVAVLQVLAYAHFDPDTP